MTDIYDRALWPSPEANPLVQLLLSGEQWFSNEQLTRALGLSPTRAMLSNQTGFARQIDRDDTAVESRDFLTPGIGVSRSNGGTMRLFNRRALVIAGMRTNTANAAAFRDWVATCMVEGFGDE